VQVGVHPASACCWRVDGVPEQPGGQVRCIGAVELAPARRKQIRAPIEQRGQARPFQPAGDEHPWCRGIHGWDCDAGPARRLVHPRGAGYRERLRDAARERGRDLRLDTPLARIIQFLDDPAGQLVRQPRHVQFGEPGHHPRQEPGLAKVRVQRLPYTRVLHFDRYLDDPASVVPPSSAVHLADRSRRCRCVVECHQPLPPARPVDNGEVSRHYPAGDVGRHGWRRVRESTKRRPVGRRDLLWHRRLEH